MAVKNPFIRYKIYSTSRDQSGEAVRLMENVKVACLITNKDMDQIPFLKKILAAAKLPENEHQIISLNPEQSISAADQGWFTQLDHILLFGMPATAIHVQLPHKMYHSSTIQETTILQLPGLEKIEPSKDEKQKLWQLMKKEFLYE